MSLSAHSLQSDGNADDEAVVAVKSRLLGVEFAAKINRLQPALNLFAKDLSPMSVLLIVVYFEREFQKDCPFSKARQRTIEQLLPLTSKRLTRAALVFLYILHINVVRRFM